MQFQLKNKQMKYCLITVKAHIMLPLIELFDIPGYQNLLKSAKVPLISDAVCRSLYKGITDNMVCAGYLAGGIDSCAGDSGGPLVCEINERYTVMGATSFGAGCAEANAPGVYAKVTAFLPWIKETIKRYS